MILLDVHNCAVDEILNRRFEIIKKENHFDKVAYTVVDFDHVMYKLGNPANDKKKISISVKIPFFEKLKKHGVLEVLSTEYGDLLSKSPEDDYDVTLIIDLDNLPEDHANLARKCALLKRTCLFSLFENFFECHMNSITDKTTIYYRNDELIYLQSQSDRVTVIFSTVFKDPDDMMIGKVFMQEFTEARRRFERAPQVLYFHRIPPLELQDMNLPPNDSIAYITFVLSPRHLISGATRENTIDLIHNVRNYLHYHIKCSKAFIQMHMRAKTVEFLKVLNRAHMQNASNPIILPSVKVNETLQSCASSIKPSIQQIDYSNRPIRSG